MRLIDNGVFTTALISYPDITQWLAFPWNGGVGTDAVAGYVDPTSIALSYGEHLYFKIVKDANNWALLSAQYDIYNNVMYWEPGYEVQKAGTLAAGDAVTVYCVVTSDVLNEFLYVPSPVEYTMLSSNTSLDSTYLDGWVAASNRKWFGGIRLLCTGTMTLTLEARTYGSYYIPPITVFTYDTGCSITLAPGSNARLNGSSSSISLGNSAVKQLLRYEGSAHTEWLAY